MPPKKDAKKGKASGKDEAEQLILQLILSKNRPFSVQNVVDSLQGKVKKTAAQKSLESLSESGQITFKEFGKNKAYFPDQSQFEAPDKEEIDAVIQGISDAEKRITELEAQRKAMEQENARLSSELTDEELVKEIARLTEENKVNGARLHRLKDGEVQIDPEEKERISQAYGTAMAEWKARRKYCMSALSRVTEWVQKSETELIDELGIDTDESAGQPLKTLEVQGIPKTAIAWMGKKTLIRKAVDKIESEIEAEQEREMEERMKEEEEKREMLIKEMGEEEYQKMILRQNGYTFPEEEEDEENNDDQEGVSLQDFQETRDVVEELSQPKKETEPLPDFDDG